MKSMRHTPELIYRLEPWEIFVFGSNEAGKHWAGAALVAQKFGAILGQGVGHAGNTYAIPTKDENIKTLPLARIKPYVDEFIRFAKRNPNLEFLVTKIGCGLAGYTVEDISPLFEGAIGKTNIIMPWEFHDYLVPERK